MKNAPSNVEHLTAKGEKGILTKFKVAAADSRNKKLKRTSEDSDRVKDLIKQYDGTHHLIKSQGLLQRQQLDRKYLIPLRRLIKIGIIHQGFISQGSLDKFHFNPPGLVEKITYRKLVKEFVLNKIFDNKSNVFYDAIREEANNGEPIDTNFESDEAKELYHECKMMNGILSKAEINAGWLKFYEIRNRDKSLIYSKLGKIENICFYLTSSPGVSSIIGIDKDRASYLSTSNLEKLIYFYCKTMNAHNSAAIVTQRKLAKSVKTNRGYIKKKTLSAKEKREMVTKLKVEGKTQKEIAKLLDCCERTVRSYWK